MTDPDDAADQLAALRADNVRLRRLLDEAGMPDSLRHGVRNTMAMLRTIMHRSAESAEEIDTYVAHLDGRLGAIARVHAITDAFGEASLHTLVSDELMVHLVREGERATIAGPPVRLRPKAAQVLAMALHELTSNGIEHGSLALPQGRVTVAWQIRPSEPEPILALMWNETGGREVARPTRRGFGTTVIEDVLAYELEARSALNYELDGLHCSLLIPFTDQVGRVVITEAERDAGDGRD